MSDLVKIGASAILLRPEHPFHALVDLIADTLSPSSRRVYRHTYDSWCAFADRFQIDYLELSFAHISAFLQDPDVAHDTRLSWKAHMLRLLDWLEESNERGSWYAQQRRQVLKFIRFQRSEEDSGGKRSKRALSKSEADALMDVWADDTRPVAVRNTAMLRLIVYAGLRRAELVMLRWEDIDLENHQTVRVRHGKGDKERVASIADVTNMTKRALEALRAAQGGAYECVFPSMTTGRDPEFATDKPMSASGVVRMLKIAVERSGVGHISAHDLRRTHITLALDNGAPCFCGHCSTLSRLRETAISGSATLEGDARPASRAQMAPEATVIAVTRSTTRWGDPMWTLHTAGGDRINVFDNMLEFPDAHDAAADVTATISVMRWAYDQAQISSSR